MHKLIIGIVLIVAIVAVGYLIYSGRITTESVTPKANNIPTLNDLLSQTDRILPLSTSTVGAMGFSDPSPANDISQFPINILTKDLITEDVIRQRYQQILNQIQVNTQTGTGQGTQSKTIDNNALQNLLGITPQQAAQISSVNIKFSGDPTVGLNALNIDQATLQRAKNDPSFLAAIQQAQTNPVRKP